MLMVARPKRKASVGRMSDTSAMAAPPVADITIQGSASRAKRMPQGSPVIAWRPSARQVAAATAARAFRGRTRSGIAARNQEATRRMIGPPKTARLVSRVDPVLA